MHAAFLQDLAALMIVAGLVTVLFHRLRQPVVLGYIVAGVVIGPHTPPLSLIHDEQTIRTLAELGVVFLLFFLGLEFSLRKARAVGLTAFVAAVAEIVLMVWIGYEVGRYFGWSTMDALFLGAMLAISSTTIIVKALDELKLKQARFAQIIFGILIVEDVLAIAMLVLLSGIAASGAMHAGDVAQTLGALAVFMIVAFVGGLLLVPRAIDYVARFGSDEVLLITVLGLCFGFCLLVMKLGYSVALGAFMIGALMAESRHLQRIERLVAPLRDMFSALFFVAIGLLLDPRMMLEYAWPIAVITAAVIVGKIVTGALGTYLAGHDGQTSMRVGMGLAQIGEFSFIIATLGVSLGVTSAFLYPIAVAVSALTTFTTPYLMRAADPAAHALGRIVPKAVARPLGLYTTWIAEVSARGRNSPLATLTRRVLAHVAVNLAVVVALFLAAAYLANTFGDPLAAIVGLRMAHALAWGGALAISLPFLIAVHRKLKAFGMALAEITVGEQMSAAAPIRSVLAEIVPLAALTGVALLLGALSASILPAGDVMIVVLLLGLGLLALLRRQFIKLHARLQIALGESLEENSAGSGEPPERH